MTGLYVDTLNQLVEKGIFTTRGEVFRAALRRIFWAYGLEPFYYKVAKLEAEKVPKAVASS